VSFSGFVGSSFDVDVENGNGPTGGWVNNIKYAAIAIQIAIFIYIAPNYYNVKEENLIN
jgi:hypothetical protein